MKRLLATVLFGGAALLLLSACGPSRGTVTGAVTYKNGPVVKGQVVFMGKDGVPVSAPLDANGNYQAKGVLYGENHVAVLPPVGASNPLTDLRKEWKAKGNEPPSEEIWKASQAALSTIPGKYHSHDDSGLKVQITKSKTTFDIPLGD